MNDEWLFHTKKIGMRNQKQILDFVFNEVCRDFWADSSCIWIIIL